MTDTSVIYLVLPIALTILGAAFAAGKAWAESRRACRAVEDIMNNHLPSIYKSLTRISVRLGRIEGAVGVKKED